MYHYLFTNDLRISTLDSSLKKAGYCFMTNTVPSSTEDKSANNNMMTLGFYFNLIDGSNCAEAAAAGNARAVVLNFIKKFQFPNPRTTTAFEECKNDGITLAPMRMIIKLLYSMNLIYGSTVAHLTKDEIKYFIFYNENVAKKKKPDILELINSIIQFRKTNIYPDFVDTNEANHEWKHEDRQIREMLKVLLWSGCVKELDGKFYIDNDELTISNKADIFDIINYDAFWEGSTIQSYREYMDMETTEIEESDDAEIGEDINMLTCLDKERKPRTMKEHPLNSIIYGAPGTGKTYSTAEYAQAIIEGISLETFRVNNPDRKEVMKKYNDLIRAGQIIFTTFHQSYGYEEFIQGLRPDTTSDKMNFKTVDGVFKKIADRALNDDENNYVIIIDEINRANISKVFGELITLIEDDKRWGELNQTSATLQSGDPFAVPNNLYIVGTMNSADKSISLIDAALRRRFEFIEQKPDASLVTDPDMRRILEKINALLAEQLDSADLLIGHSYFMNRSIDELPKVLNNSIIPLLYEYFYDNKKKVMGILNSAVEQVDYVIEDDKLGRIFVERQKKN